MEAESQLCIDQTGTVVRQAFQGTHPLQGAPGLIEIILNPPGENVVPLPVPA